MDARAGVVHQDVDLAESVHHFSCCASDLIGLGNVCGHRDRGHPERIQLLDDLICSAGISDEQHDVVPASARAVTRARPMPRLAPVTTETFPESENASTTDIPQLLVARPAGRARQGGASLGLEDCAFRQGQIGRASCRERVLTDV